MNFIRYKNIWIGISAALAGASVAALLAWGLRPGIDFTGGSLIEVEFVSGDIPPVAAIRGAVEATGAGAAVVQPLGERSVAIRLPSIEEKKHQEILSGLSDLVREEKEKSSDADRVVVERRFDAIGPSLGRELRRRAFGAIAIAGAGIILYIAWAFRTVSDPVPSWKYGVIAVVALLHDIAIPAGVFSALGRFWGVEVDALFVTALLTIMGFSVHDTIVVFDRIRENLRRATGAEPFAALVSRSVRETLVRSLNTSGAVLLVLAGVAIFGGQTTRFFSFALMIGIAVGTYSSLFLASPLLVFWNRRSA